MRDASAPIPIVYVIKEMVVGGSQTHLMQVLRLLDRRLFSPALCCLSGKGNLLDDVRALDVEILTPAPGRSFKGVGLAAHVFALSRSLRGRGTQIVHNYLLRANLVGSVSARLAGVPLVLCSKRGCHERRGFELVTAKIGNALADRVTANAIAVREFVHANEGCALDKMTVIPSGIDTARFQPLAPADFKARLQIPGDRVVVGVVTRSRVRKGVDEFVRAIALLRNDYPQVHGVVVGDVEVDADVTALLDQQGVREHISFLGRRKDMPEVLSAFDIFVLASHDEGMSNAILEAMAMEKPVVATDVGGTGEVVQNGETGLLVPAKNPVALANAIAEIVGDAPRRRAMGELGRRTVEAKFSANAMVRQMEQMYLEIARQRGLDWRALAAN